jgi:hypothetical protein
MKKLTMKKTTGRMLPPLSAFAAMIALGVPSANAQDVFNASFPDSWNGTSTTVTDPGTTDVGYQSGTATYSTTAVPSDAGIGTGSMALTGVGGIKVTPNALLNNASIASAGGFTYNIDFMWDGTDSTSYGHAEKLIDYSGTESLQLVTTSGSASLQMLFADNTGVESTAVSTTILPNTWYNVTMAFYTGGNSVVTGAISGTAGLYVDGNLVSSGSATKGSYGDGLNRPIGIGEFGYGHTTSIIGLHGDIYDASINLGADPVATPEPSTMALLSGFGGLATLLKFRRRKA